MGDKKQSACCSATSCSSTKPVKNRRQAAIIKKSDSNIPVISTSLDFGDKIGAWKARFGINRMNYKVEPGLYAVGSPNNLSPVLVSANYKLSFDSLRKELDGLNLWILVLDTKGINVWCAAGKGTFGTNELVNRIFSGGLSDVVSHRKIILPQLGAPGVKAHTVAKKTGFTVIYGPVRAKDIKAFIDSDFKATKEMRTVNFTFFDRLVLTPMEFIPAAKLSLTVFGVLFLINLIASRPFGLVDFVAYFGAVAAGSVIAPVMLPYIPGRAFGWKGWLVGFLWVILFIWLNGWFKEENRLLAAGYLLLLPAFSAFLAMNFTGASTYTSFSGVIKEMKISLPLIIAASLAGAALILLEKMGVLL